MSSLISSDVSWEGTCLCPRFCAKVSFLVPVCCSHAAGLCSYISLFSDYRCLFENWFCKIGPDKWKKKTLFPDKRRLLHQITDFSLRFHSRDNPSSWKLWICHWTAGSQHPFPSPASHPTIPFWDLSCLTNWLQPCYQMATASQNAFPGLANRGRAGCSLLAFLVATGQADSKENQHFL